MAAAGKQRTEIAKMFCIRNILLILFALISWMFLVDANNDFELELISLTDKKGEGRVEVIRRDESGPVSGNICDNDWDEKDAIVACRQLGFTNVGFPVKGDRTKLRYGSGFEVDYFYSEFNCNGSESLLRDCPSVTYNSMTERRCIPNEQAAGLMCFSDFDVRLVSGKSDTEGLLEVFYEGDWTNVRSEDFDENTANVACMQVGLQEVTVQPKHTKGIIIPASSYGIENGYCQFTNFDCLGNETNIRECDYTRAARSTGCIGLVAIRCDDPCRPSDGSLPCRNGGLCEATIWGSYICRCIGDYSGQICTLGGVTSPIVDLSTLEIETVVLVTTLGLIGLFLILTLLTTIISRFAFQHALERIIFEADQELESKDPGDFDRHIEVDEYYEEGDYDGEGREGGVEGFGEDEEEYVVDKQEFYHEERDKERNSDESLGAYDQRFEGSYDVNLKIT